MIKSISVKSQKVKENLKLSKIDYLTFSDYLFSFLIDCKKIFLKIITIFDSDNVDIIEITFFFENKSYEFVVLVDYLPLL